MARADRLTGPVLAVALVVTLVVTLLSGCSATREVKPAEATVHDRWAGCRDVRPYVNTGEANTRTDGGAPPSGFAATVLVRCDDLQQSGLPIQAVEQHAVDLTGFLPVLALPSLTSRSTVTCPGIEYRPPWLFLLDADQRWVTVGIPRNVCGLPRTEFDQAYAQLQFTVAATT